MEWIKQSEAARRLQIPRQKITKWIKEGLLKTNNKNVNFEDVKKLFDYGNLFNKYGNSVYKDISEARLAYESWRAKMAELDYLTRKNELGEIQEFEFIAANIIEVTKSRILSAADRLPPLIVGEENEKGIRQILRKELIDALNELTKLNNYK